MEGAIVEVRRPGPLWTAAHALALRRAGRPQPIGLLPALVIALDLSQVEEAALDLGPDTAFSPEQAGSLVDRERDADRLAPRRDGALDEELLHGLRREGPGLEAGER